MRIASLLSITVLFFVSGCSSSGGGDDRREPTRGAASGPPVSPGDAHAGIAGAAAPPAAPRDPSLMPGDVLDISVYGEPDLRLEVRIPDGGAFPYPLIGEVAAAGLTTASLARTIRDRLAADYLQKPQVTVNVKSFATRKVYVLGGVQKPDGYEIQPTERITLLQLVSLAGGISDRASREACQVVRRDGEGKREVIQVSLAAVEEAISRGKAEADFELWPDDLVVIPSAARSVYVLGAVAEPGAFELTANVRMTVSMALSRAGSYTKFAATGSIQVLRQGVGGARRIPVDLSEIVKGNLEKDVELVPGDVVWVPERGLF